MYEFSEVMKTYRQGFLITILATMFDDAKCPISSKDGFIPLNIILIHIYQGQLLTLNFYH